MGLAGKTAVTRRAWAARASGGKRGASGQRSGPMTGDQTRGSPHLRPARPTAAGCTRWHGYSGPSGAGIPARPAARRRTTAARRATIHRHRTRAGPPGATQMPNTHDPAPHKCPTQWPPTLPPWTCDPMPSPKSPTARGLPRATHTGTLPLDPVPPAWLLAKHGHTLNPAETSVASVMDRAPRSAGRGPTPPVWSPWFP